MWNLEILTGIMIFFKVMLTLQIVQIFMYIYTSQSVHNESMEFLYVS